MLSRSARLLCVGDDPALLETRCAVLNQAGYDAQAATVSEFESLLPIERFDLIIVSAWLTEWNRDQIISAVGSSATLELHGLTLASDLLAQVERLMVPTSSGISKSA